MKSASISLPSLTCLVLLSVFTLFSCRNVSESGNDETAVTAATPGPHTTPRSEPDIALSSPRLVVGIVVDQMRYEFLARYMDRFGEGGIRRLLAGGYSFDNAKFNYVPTKTCPGHASIYTGATPSVHGIIGNSWYDESPDAKFGKMYCAYDVSAYQVGGSSDTASGNIWEKGYGSPKNMLSSTVSDELRLATGMNSVVIGISLKDRGAIMPAGHLGDAYWFDGGCGCWVTSSYYYERGGEKSARKPRLPKWVSDFNETSSAEQFLERPGIKKKWDTLNELTSYQKTSGGDARYVRSIMGSEADTDGAENRFPYDLSKALTDNKDEFKGKWGNLIQYTPYGNSLTNEFAIAALNDAGLSLGRDDVTDFLAVSYSSTDLVGHFYGPRSVEVEDTYLRLDMDIENLLNGLDEAVGEGNYLVFLTADHGVVDVPQYLRDLGIPAGYFIDDDVKDDLNRYLKGKFDTGDKNLVLAYTNQQVYLDRALISQDPDLDLPEVQKAAASYLLTLDGVADVVTATELNGARFTRGMRRLVQNGFYPKRSGDVAVIQKPSWIEYSGYFGRKGTTHSQGYNYDTHVPLIFYGWNIKHGSSVRPVEITDIAPTVSALLGIPFPNGATGNPLIELFE